MYKTSTPYSLNLRRATVWPESQKIVTRETVLAWRVARTLPSPGGPKNSAGNTTREVTITKEDGLVGDDQPISLRAAA
jgi:hypothetical protein